VSENPRASWCRFGVLTYLTNQLLCSNFANMDYPAPANAEAIINNMRWHTEGSTVLAYHSAGRFPNEDTSGWQLFLLKTKNGKYFTQRDSYLTNKYPAHSDISPLSLGKAVTCYEQFNMVRIVGFTEAFPGGLPEA